jgi:adenosylhomocysteine nucleosidase
MPLWHGGDKRTPKKKAHPQGLDHLKIPKEGQGMRILVIGAMETEIEALVLKLKARPAGQLFGMAYFSTRMDPLEIQIIQCGIGKVNATAITQKAICGFHPDFIINTGIAGTTHPENRIGDVIIGQELTYHDVRRGQMKHCFPCQAAFYSDADAVHTLKEMIRSTHHKRVKAGRIASGERFINNAEEKEKIHAVHAPDCVDMESTAIAHTAFINCIPFVCIRTICDHADENSLTDFTAFEKENAAISAGFTFDYLMHLLEKKRPSSSL